MSSQELLDALKALTKSNKRKPKPQIPTFSGRTSGKSKDNSYEDWIYMVEKVNDHKAEFELTDQKGLEIAVFQSVVGEARSRYIRLDKAGKSITEILAEFKLAYSDKTDVYERITRFNDLKQHKSECVQEYADKLEKLQLWILECSEATGYFENDKMMKLTFVRGLRDRTLPHKLLYLIDDEGKKYQDIRTKAISLEKEQSSLDKAVKVVQDAESSLVSRLEQRVAYLEGRGSSEKKPHKVGKKQFTLKCYFCKEPGHFKYDCPKYKKRAEQLKKEKQGNAQ